MVSVPIVVLAIGGYVWATSGRSVSTDNAYVKRGHQLGWDRM